MDTSMPQQPTRQLLSRADSGGKHLRSSDKDNLDDRNVSAKSAMDQKHKTGRYKEKFQALKEKYDQVTSTNEQYKRELAIAEDKVKRLQGECNLLLDAVDIAVPAQPSLLHYLAGDPIPPHYQSYTAVPVPPREGPSSPPLAVQQLREHHVRAMSGQGPVETVVMPDVGPLCAEDVIPDDLRRMNHQLKTQLDRR